jgi:AraC-like DNA-binding protein
MKAIPGDCIELGFCFTKARYVSPGIFNINNPQIYLGGIQRYDQVIICDMLGSGRGGCFNISFKPTGFYRLFGIKSSDLTKYILDCKMVVKRMELDHLDSKIQQLHSVEEMKKCTEEHLLKFIDPKDRSILDDIYNYMSEKKGMTRISELSRIFNISPRSLHRKFTEECGIPPKELLNILRINYAIKILEKKPDANLSHISYLCDFYDQSHFCRELKKISGLTPADLIYINPDYKTDNYNRFFIRDETFGN